MNQPTPEPEVAAWPRPAGEWAAALVLLVLLSSLLLRLDQPLNHDVAWFMTAAERMWNGGNYLEDFFEVNAPLAIAIYMPAELFTSAAGASAHVSVWTWTYAVVVLVLALVWTVVRYGSGATRTPIGLVAWSTILLAVLPAYDFAQREHLLAALVLPFLLAMGFGPESLGRWLRLGVALLAALGCYLKPHFALLPVLLLMGRANRYGWRSIAGVEFVALVIVAMIYVLWILVWYPDWIVVARWAVDLYGELRGSGIERFTQAESIIPTTVASALLIVVAIASDDRTRSRLLPFVIATAYAWAVFFLQGKGWRYQMVPAAIFAFAWLPLFPWRRAWTQPGAVGRRMLTVAAAVLSVVLGVHVVQVNRDAPKLSNLARSPIGEALSIARGGDRVHVISTAVIPFFPAVTHLDLRWGSRYSALWPLAGLGRDAGAERPDADLAHYHTEFIGSVAGDLRRFTPEIAIVDLRPGQFGVARGFDMLAYLNTSREFAREWREYRLLGESRDYAIYVRTIEQAQSDGAGDQH